MGKPRLTLKMNSGRSKSTKARCVVPAIPAMVWVDSDANLLSPYSSNFLSAGYMRSFADVASGSQPPPLSTTYDTEHFRLNLNYVVSNAVDILNGLWKPMLPFTAAFLRIAVDLQLYFDTIVEYSASRHEYDSAISIEDLAFLAIDALNFCTRRNQATFQTFLSGLNSRLIEPMRLKQRLLRANLDEMAQVAWPDLVGTKQFLFKYW